MKLLKALIVEDSEDDALMLLRHLKRGGYEIEYQRVDTAESMDEALHTHDWQVILSDYSMPQFDGIKALTILKESGIDIPFIMISGTIGEDTAVQAMLAGVDDYFIKGNLNRLVPAIERELEEADNRRARRRAESELEESKRRLQIALHAAGMGVWEWNLQTNDVYWSRECYEIFGSEEFDGNFDAFVERLHPDDAYKVIRTAKRAVKKHTNFKTEFRAIKENGEMIWLENYGSAEYDADGKPLRFVGTVQEITRRKESELALRDSEERLRLATDVAKMFSWESDYKTKKIKWSDNAAKIIGCSPDELTDDMENSRFFVAPEERDWLVECYRQMYLDRKRNYVVEFRGMGNKFWQSNGVIFYDSTGALLKVVGVTQDITERIAAEEELRKSEERFRSLVNTTAQIVWTANANGEITSALTQYRNAFEDDTEKSLTDQWVDRLHPEEKERVLKEFLEALRKKEAYTHEFRILLSDELYHNFVARGTPVYEKDGTIREWVGTLTDITRNKLSEEKLRKSEEQLRQAQKLESVGRLAGGIAHDFNNMLTAINGYSDLALRRLSENDPLRRNLEEIKKAGERSAALTQQLLAFSRRTILQMEVLDINQIVGDSIVMLQRLIGEDIQILSDLNPKIHRIKADAGQLSQMLLNLVVNSRDAMPQGGTITIETENIYLDEEFTAQNPGSRQGNYVMLAVSDTGIGIDEETRQLIFEPFFTTKEIGKGTGLGLSTVYGIVNQLGGYIVVKSTVGVGTTFVIYLPSVEDEKSADGKYAKDGDIERGVETILLVEDEELVRNLTRQVLETCGYDVIEAKDGFEAVELCRRQGLQIDLLFTDVVMPKMSGRELAERVRKFHPQIKILFTSGYTEDAVVRHGISESEMNFLQKPFSFDDLSKKVRMLLDNKKG